jgi:hypothetical protein
MLVPFKQYQRKLVARVAEHRDYRVQILAAEEEHLHRVARVALQQVAQTAAQELVRAISVSLMMAQAQATEQVEVAMDITVAAVVGRLQQFGKAAVVDQASCSTSHLGVQRQALEQLPAIRRMPNDTQRQVSRETRRILIRLQRRLTMGCTKDTWAAS